MSKGAVDLKFSPDVGDNQSNIVGLKHTHPTSRSSMVPGWKGGKALPLGGSFGEYSLKDLEQPEREKERCSAVIR